MKESKKITCITCPIGCQLTITKEEDKLVEISGNKCPRGTVYAKNEFYNPKRALTSTVKIIGGTIEQLPVKTKEPIPKEKVKEAMLILKDLTTQAPVKTGDVILDDLVKTGIPLIATRSVRKKEN